MSPKRNDTFLIKINDLLELAGVTKLERGKRVFDDRRVLSLEFRGKETVRATVLGEKPYAVNLTSGAGRAFHCTCPSFEKDGFCKHCVAVILAAEPGLPFQSIRQHYGKRFLNRVGRISNRVRPNPGEKLLKLRRSEDQCLMDEVCVWGKYRYRWTRCGVAVWGGDSASALLKAFDALKMKDGYRLDGYYSSERLGGHFMPFVLPAGQAMPDWRNNSNPIFGPEDIPAGIDPMITNYILADHSAKSYFQKSVFLRELSSMGTYWHSESNWNVHGIVWDESDARLATGGGPDCILESKPLPGCFLPRVTYLADHSVEVSFYCFSWRMGATCGLFKYTDRHLPDGTAHGEQECLIDLGLGPTP